MARHVLAWPHAGQAPHALPDYGRVRFRKDGEDHGWEMCIRDSVTTTDKDDQSFALLRELGMPFRGDEKPIVVAFTN